ncbi:Uncharacterized protein HZ326_29259 [Fusarium oxysporum f. sp. albedinis]|nr:Uncharacterized protein HZ326_29259 [Fusarium oxysporum f. sp. albedinis]
MEWENCCYCVVIGDGKYLGYALFHKEIQVFSNPHLNFHSFPQFPHVEHVEGEMLKPTWNGMEWIWIHIMDPYVDFVRQKKIHAPYSNLLHPTVCLIPSAACTCRGSISHLKRYLHKRWAAVATDEQMTEQTYFLRGVETRPNGKLP